MPFLVNPYILGQAGGNAVVFDSGEYLSRASSLSGISNTKLFTASIWLVGNHMSQYDQYILSMANTYGANTSVILVTGAGRIGVNLWTTAGGSFSISGSPPFVAGSVGLVKHVHFAVDMDNASNKALYVNQVDASSSISFTVGQTLDMSMTSVDVCQPGSGGGGYAHVWIAPGQYEPDYTKFINGDGTPKDLGADGSTPTGTAPAIFFTGDKSAFPVNNGTGGSFTLIGSLDDSPVPLMAL